MVDAIRLAEGFECMDRMRPHPIATTALPPDQASRTSSAQRLHRTWCVAVLYELCARQSMTIEAAHAVAGVTHEPHDPAKQSDAPRN
jgi:hypothetical protein